MHRVEKCLGLGVRQPGFYLNLIAYSLCNFGQMASNCQIGITIVSPQGLLGGFLEMMSPKQLPQCLAHGRGPKWWLII